MAEKKYNPYAAANSIYNSKVAYNKAKNTGGDYDSVAENAKKYYQELRDNGYGALADNLANSTEEQAAGIMKSYAPDADTDTLSSTVNSLLNSSSGSGLNAGQYNADYENMLKTVQGYMRPSDNQKRAQDQTLAALQDQINAFSANNMQIAGMNSGAQGMINDAYNNTNLQVGDIYKYLYADPYKSDAAKSIMSYYDQLGGKAAGNATAAAAASNAGNIDSYSAANANRQKLSYTNAGNNAVLNQYNSTAANLLGTLQQYGVNVSDLIGQYNTLIGNSQKYNNGILDSYNSANTENNALLEKQRATDAGVYESLGKNLTDLYGKSMDNSLNEYLGKLTAGTTAQGNMIGSDKEIALRKLLNELGVIQDAGETTRTGMNTQSAEKIAGINANSNENVAKTGANATVEAAKLKQVDNSTKGTTLSYSDLLEAFDVLTTEGVEYTGNKPISAAAAFELLRSHYPDYKNVINAMEKDWKANNPDSAKTSSSANQGTNPEDYLSTN